VEAGDIATVAARVFEANGVKDRVTLVPGWSRRIQLPERADLLVAGIIGYEPFEEEISPGTSRSGRMRSPTSTSRSTLSTSSPTRDSRSFRVAAS